ncbi:MAG: zinc ribbon domain-containing protein [Promethearchaeota archaeon]
MQKWKKYAVLILSFAMLFQIFTPATFAQRQTETVNEYYDYSDSNGYLCNLKVSLYGFPTIENRRETYTATLTIENLVSDVEIRLKRISWKVSTDKGVESDQEEIDVLLNAVGNSYDFEFNVKSISQEYSGDATLTAEFRHDIYREGSKKKPDEKASISADLVVYKVEEESPSPTNPNEGNGFTGTTPSFRAISNVLPGLILLILMFVVIGAIARKRTSRRESGMILTMSGTQIENMSYDELLSRRNVLEEGLRRIETQLNTGLLSPQQYMDIYTQYRSEWITINRKLSEAGISDSEVEGEIIPSTMEELACPACGESYPSDSQFCPHCGEERENCTVCLLPMTPGSEITKCPHCDGLAHKDHLQEWVKIKGFCPKCKNKLTEYDLTQ